MMAARAGATTKTKMTKTFSSARNFKRQLVDAPGLRDGLGVRKQFIPDEVKQVGSDDDRTFRFTISTGSVDRDKDTLAVKGWELGNFRKNPVVLFAHDSRRPPIGRAAKIFVEGNSLKADAEFMDSDTDISGFADTIFRMVKGGFLKTTSVGFLPIEFEFVSSKDDEDRVGGIDFLKQELLEFSIVPVPANPDALIQARSKGINTVPIGDWCECTLDEWDASKDTICLPRSEVETLARAANGKSIHALPKRKTPVTLTTKALADMVGKAVEGAVNDAVMQLTGRVGP